MCTVLCVPVPVSGKAGTGTPGGGAERKQGGGKQGRQASLGIEWSQEPALGILTPDSIPISLRGPLKFAPAQT